MIKVTCPMTLASRTITQAHLKTYAKQSLKQRVRAIKEESRPYPLFNISGCYPYKVGCIGSCRSDLPLHSVNARLSKV
jgi:hypothetical protein